MQMIPQGGGFAPPSGESLHTLATEKFEIRVVALSGLFVFFGNRQCTLSAPKVYTPIFLRKTDFKERGAREKEGEKRKREREREREREKFPC